MTSFVATLMAINLILIMVASSKLNGVADRLGAIKESLSSPEYKLINECLYNLSFTNEEN